MFVSFRYSSLSPRAAVVARVGEVEVALRDVALDVEAVDVRAAAQRRLSPSHDLVGAAHRSEHAVARVRSAGSQDCIQYGLL